MEGDDQGLDSFGCTIVNGSLTREECRSLAAMYERDVCPPAIVMARHGFGRGEYKYWSYPLPEIIADLRPCTAARCSGQSVEPVDENRRELSEMHEEYLKRCHAVGQQDLRPCC